MADPIDDFEYRYSFALEKAKQERRARQAKELNWDDFTKVKFDILCEPGDVARVMSKLKPRFSCEILEDEK